MLINGRLLFEYGKLLLIYGRLIFMCGTLTPSENLHFIIGSAIQPGD